MKRKGRPARPRQRDMVENIIIEAIQWAIVISFGVWAVFYYATAPWGT